MAAGLPNREWEETAVASSQDRLSSINRPVLAVELEEGAVAVVVVVSAKGVTGEVVVVVLRDQAAKGVASWQ